VNEIAVVNGMTETKIPKHPASATLSNPYKGRHPNLMGPMGAAIGAGFCISYGLPFMRCRARLLLAYLLAGTVMYLIRRALGE